MWTLVLLTALQLAGAGAQAAAPGADNAGQGVTDPVALGIPEVLQPWIPWVLTQGPDGQDRRGCPIGDGDGQRICAWPGALSLDLSAQAGRFEQQWTLFADQWIPLPGDADTWPLDVLDGGNPLAVVLRDGRPAVRLSAGSHTLTGAFGWSRRPESLVLPAETGMLTLVLDGEAQPLVQRATDGRLWLREPRPPAGEEAGDQLRVEVYRRIEDSLPLQVTTRLELEVSGRAREVRLGPVPLAGGVPLDVRSPLPTRLEMDGLLYVQVSPGRWQITVTSYQAGAVSALARAHADAPWPAREVWVFVAHPELRQVEIGGLSPLDPSQTRLPKEWTRFPVYLVGPGERMTLAQQRRGDADPEPDRLGLARELWLDFDGSGYTVRDRISGQLTRHTRLDAGAELALGQVQVDGSPQLITRLEPATATGVEVRQGHLDLVADGRLEDPPEVVPASGWAFSLMDATSRLYLPPGWDLLAVSGVDNLPDTWLYRWTLLDLFLVLILTIGIGRIWGWAWGALGLAALALTWQSPGAPQLVWLHLLAAAALLRLLPQASLQAGVSRLRGLVLWYWRLSLVALLVVGLPFLVAEVRGGLYPHLERASWGVLGAAAVRQPATELDGAGGPPAPSVGFDEFLSERSSRMVEDSAESLGLLKASPAPRPLERLDPNAQVQTGPGIPSWQSKAYELVWTGPVGQTEQARLWLLTPTWNLILALCGSLLIVLLGLRLAGVVRDPKHSQGVLVLLLACGLGGLTLPAPTRAAELPRAELPSMDLLGQLRERLLEPPDCLPQCLELSRLSVRAEPERLTLELTLDAAVPLAAPVPGGSGGWSPTEQRLDGDPLDRIRRGADGRLLAPVPAGRHSLLLAGPLPARNAVGIPLPLAPRHLQVEADGWRVEGLDADGRPGRQIQLVRLAETGAQTDRPLTQDALPPLLLVERRLGIGLDWRVETRVSRLSSPEFPVLLPISLLPGEAVQTPGVQVEDGRVRLALAPGEREAVWVSSLEPISDLTLSASTDTRLAESWQLDVSTLWHMDAAGIPPVHQRGESDRWLPSWRPLPGETLTLRFTRPAGVPGPTLTLDRVDFQVAPGRRGSDAVLVLQIRSSQGGRHRLRLPAGAELRELAVDGRALPLPSDPAAIELPLTPGAQEIRLAWQTSQVLTISYRPTVPDLGATAVNVSERLRVPDDRWVLMVAGPEIGPAVLFWGVLIVMAGLAVVLGRSPLTPLRMHDWFFLSIGLSLSHVWVMLLVAAWLFALGVRRRLDASTGPWRFNLTQVGLILLTLLALAALIGAVQQGLLGRPEMQIVGNGSYGGMLSWYQDRAGPLLPDVWVLSVPMWVYRALMLAWALWLAFRLLDWLRWGWEGFSRPQLWRERAKTQRAASGKEAQERPWTPSP
ncbi:hypothetical protein [Thiocystis violacea]|uniref:hypothetical protein n=1 Tax=Thiocystis violacea TaxID=13725 RepID=UPI0019069EB8|nr:hypothetical protein [Thiocystis violacea]